MTTKGRRGHNEGSVFYRAEKNSWRALVTVDGRRLSHNGKTRQECQQWLKETIKQIDNGLTYNASQIKVSDFLEDWLTSIKSSIKPGSYYQYDMTIHTHILPYIGMIFLKELRLDQIQKLYNKKLETGTGKSTIDIMHRVLHQAFKHAVVLRIIPYNPTDGVIVPKQKRKEMKFYNETQVSQLLMAVKETRNEALYQMEISSGMRESELLGLKWSDVDWKNRTISISRQLVHNHTNSKSKDEYFGSLKTDSSNRTISLGDYTVEKLRDHMKIQDIERKESTKRGKWIEHDLIFPSKYGTPMNQGNLLLSFRNITRHAGLPEIRFHDLRHTAATLMLNHGVPVIVVSKRLGHSSVSITLDVYGHLIPSAQEGVGNLMDDLITPIELPTNSFCAPFKIVEKQN
jgi:integrase